ncbi:hypothetical protein OIU84_021387 [Salix udensis]|uniref:THH1/TOM1/TOM3 domain-containing protein n=1 Tax=Salix udensis TaxID=889485 RepID=A0AAD6KUH9_9ROSI|nr:hypothetical protein OIU84_021387 [Salix udensis]
MPVVAAYLVISVQHAVLLLSAIVCVCTVMQCDEVRFPVESKGRRKKLQEVGYVTTICFSCFLVRCIMMCFNAFDEAADLDVLDHPCSKLHILLAGGDFTFIFGSFHSKEIAS